jgi:hypothetical protein
MPSSVGKGLGQALEPMQSEVEQVPVFNVINQTPVALIEGVWVLGAPHMLEPSLDCTILLTQVENSLVSRSLCAFI